jgi:DNA-binding CsgD family transcriptional regulator
VGAAGRGRAESVRRRRRGHARRTDALWELTPQQRQIVRLASDGLTNREIGDRLFLSPRTVSSHLYRSFPKLGVTDRHQLRDVIARASTPPLTHENAESDSALERGKAIV